MAAGRLILVIGALGAIGIVLAQNASVPLQLVFLGQPTIALPLGVWVVLAGLAGAGTTGVLTVLFRWSNHLTRQATKRDLRVDGVGSAFAGPSASTAPASPSSRRDAVGKTHREPSRPRWPWSATATPPSASSSMGPPPIPTAPPPTAVSDRTPEAHDDWTVDDRDRDWEDTPPRPKTTPTPPTSTAEPSPFRPEERPEVPPAATPSRHSSLYSYSSQQPRNTAVGRSEAIYDAEYRVIIPPYRPLAEETSDADYADADYADTDYADADYADSDALNDEYNQADEEDAFEDEDEELGDEVFDDWEEETGTTAWPRQ